jgi:glycine dehydrogenase subunit 1
MAVVKNYVKPENTVKIVAFDQKTGRLNLSDLREKLSDKTAAVYFENPNYIGAIETEAREIIEVSKDAGAFVIAGVDPSVLGVLEAPGEMGADYAVGDYQPFGLHMGFGGSLSGFICTRDEEKYIAEYPMLLFGLTDTVKEGEYGFGEVYYDRTSYASREKGKDFVGTATALHGIVAGIYMALMGPQGFSELGRGIMQRSAYAKKKLAGINGIDIPIEGVSYCDFLVNFDKTGKTVEEMNKALLDEDIFGGGDVSKDFPVYGQSALFSITEMHSKEDIDKLITALADICGVSG